MICDCECDQLCDLVSLATVDVEGAQTASTDNRLSTFGQGSSPKLLFAITTAHLCFPMHLCQRGKRAHIFHIVIIFTIIYREGGENKANGLVPFLAHYMR